MTQRWFLAYKKYNNPAGFYMQKQRILSPERSTGHSVSSIVSMGSYLHKSDNSIFQWEIKKTITPRGCMLLVEAFGWTGNFQNGESRAS